MSRADVLLPLSLGLGEGLIALDDSSFLFVDIHLGRVGCGAIDGTVRFLATLEHSVGAVVPTRDGGVLWSGGTAVGMLGADDRIELPDPAPGIRMNDGKADPVGRFVGGTMTEPVRDGAGALWSFSGGASELLLENVTISNGLCWSRSGDTMFYIDTPTQRVDEFDYELETGRVSERRTVIDVPAEVGSPDGMTIDAEGGLWIALWGGSAVHRYLDGQLDHVVELPTPFATSITFVEQNVIVTTAAEPAPGDEMAGHVFVAEVGLRAPLPHVADTATVFGSGNIDR